MKKYSFLSGIMTYILIVFLVIGINLIIYFPVNNIIKESINIEKQYNEQISSIEGNEQLKEFYTNYSLDVKSNYIAYYKIFTNMIVTLFVIISLTLVIIGLTLRVNTNRNKGIYNAIIFSGITCIFYLIWFSISITNSFTALM